MMDRLLLCTDMDRTIIPNGPQPESPGARARFAELARAPEVTLVYVTGRYLELVEAALIEWHLPRPDYLIGDVGTTLYQYHDGGWRLDHAWTDEIGTEWHGMLAADLYPALRLVSPALRLQESAKQNRYKLSFYAPHDIDATALCDTIQARLATLSVPASLIWSVDETLPTGLLDILPPRADKRRAIEFVAARLGFTHDQCLFAGDSGNDLAVLTSPIPGVLVANATAAVRAAAERIVAANGNANALYLARGESAFGMNGNYAAGVLEGIEHFHRPLLRRIFATEEDLP
ncbi:MAG: HAD-IIB family hydrolase [Thiotrichales bacterium]